MVSTRHYRAPEIIMQLGWSYPADMWSMGCILVELLTGEVLFGLGQAQSDNTLAHIAAMHQLLGPFPCAAPLPPPRPMLFAVTALQYIHIIYTYVCVYLII